MSSMVTFLGRLLHGMRLLEFVAVVAVLLMALGVYTVKASAGRERAQIAAAKADIDREARRVRLLQAEIATLEQPQRIQRLAREMGLGPTAADRFGPPLESHAAAVGMIKVKLGGGR
jgi:cell division protein FtsL